MVVIKDGLGGKHVLYKHGGWMGMLDCHLNIGCICTKTKL
jgi:hypothetical protein